MWFNDPLSAELLNILSQDRWPWPVEITRTADWKHTCRECGITHFMPYDFAKSRAETGKEIYCPNGHTFKVRLPDKDETEACDVTAKK